jgi:hypothetical protein
MSDFTYTALGTVVAVGVEGQRVLGVKRCFSEIRRFKQIARIRRATRLVSATEIYYCYEIHVKYFMFTLSTLKKTYEK